VRTVRFEDFDLDNMTLHVRGKGDKGRVVPVSNRAWGVLAMPVARAMMNQCEVVGLKDRFARRVITELGVRAKLERHTSSHDLRATFATAVYDHTLDQRVVQELLGHSSGTTTEIYIGRSNDQMRKAVEGL
jgi:site-specific recombinase XerD